MGMDWDMLTKHVIKKGLSQIEKSPTGGFGCARLELRGQSINTLEGDLGNYTMLEFIDMSNNKVSDLTVLQDLTNLHAIRFQSNLLTSLGDFSKLKHLQVGEFDSNQIESFEGSHFPHISALTLSRNKIQGFEELTPLTEDAPVPRLSVLVMTLNNVSTTKGIGNLPLLEAVDLRGNKITNLEGVEQLSVLRQLDLRDNQLPNMSALSPLSNLPMLSYLATTGNSNIHTEEADPEALVLEVLILLPQLKQWNDMAVTDDHRMAAEALRKDREAAKAEAEAAEKEAAAEAAAAEDQE